MSYNLKDYKGPIRIKPVDLEKIYSQENRENDVQKIKQFFEINPKLLKVADGMKLISTFIQDKDSIFQN